VSPAAAKICPTCRAENREISRFCADCGVRIEKMPEIGVSSVAGKASEGVSRWANKQATRSRFTALLGEKQR